jgi:spore coat protein U-like protein
MTFETADSVTLKIWDRSTVHHTLDALVHDLSVRHNTSKGSIAVTCSGPNTFTVSLNHGA